MEQPVVIRNPADTQWYGLNKDGSLAYSKYRLDGLPAYGRIKAHAPITSFCMLQNDGILHIMADTASGMYYIKVVEHSLDQQELRIATGTEARFPYLFLYKSVLYVCCIVMELEQPKLFLKTWKSGLWHERSFPLFGEEGASVRLDDAMFTISNQGKLHGLFRYRNPQGECVLSCLEYDVEQDARTERRLFALKQKNQRWQLGLDVDSLGMPHYVWTILSGGTAAYYYVNADREARSSMPLLINRDQDAAIPHFLFANEFILVLFWDGDEQIEYVYSLNQGRSWSASGHIHFGKQSSMRMVQSIRKQSCVVSPEKLLGFHMPFFRPLEFIDLFNPLVGLGFSGSTVERLHWIKLQMEYLYRDFLQHTSKLRLEASEIALLNEAMEDQVRHLMREVDQLKEEEQKVLGQLKGVNEIQAEEPFSLRFIR